jgi:hypothetical protein
MHESDGGNHWTVGGLLGAGAGSFVSAVAAASQF